MRPDSSLRNTRRTQAREIPPREEDSAEEFWYIIRTEIIYATRLVIKRHEANTHKGKVSRTPFHWPGRSWIFNVPRRIFGTHLRGKKFFSIFFSKTFLFKIFEKKHFWHKKIFENFLSKMFFSKILTKIFFGKNFGKKILKKKI